MEEIHELLGYQALKIYQRKDAFSFSLDSMLLADFVDVKSHTKQIIELGCGNAPILLFLTLKTRANLIGIELQKEIYDLAIKSVEVNNLTSQIKIYNQDLKGIYKTVGNNTFDIVISNPPFFKTDSSNLNKNDLLTIARHEVAATLEDIILEARRLLVDGGRLYMVHRCERMTEVALVLNKYNFGIKRLRFIYSKPSSTNALMFLIEARQNKKDDVKVLNPLIVYDDNNQYSAEVKKIFNFKQD